MAFNAPQTSTRKPNFREGNPKTDQVDPVSTGVELQSNKNLSGGRDLARPLNPGLLAGFKQTGRKGRKGRAK